jgi:hypothetical protein
MTGGEYHWTEFSGGFCAIFGAFLRLRVLFKALLDSAIAATVAAIEIYNKPDFRYREPLVLPCSSR